jgi:H+/Cl- antiporter ClcA
MNKKIPFCKEFRIHGSYILIILRWTLYASVMGIVCGLLGVAFDKYLELASETFSAHPSLILGLPFAGLAIVLLYRLCRVKKDNGTEMIIESVRDNEPVPYLAAPLVFLCTGITHLFGGSSGREGAALQIGGSVGTFLGRILHFKEKDTNILALSGMSALFSAVFGTPVTAAIMAVEIISMGNIYYVAIFPCLLSAVIAYKLALLFSVTPTAAKMPEIQIPAFSVSVAGKVLLAALLFSLVVILFVTTMKGVKKLFGKIQNEWVRIFLGGLILLALTCLVYFLTGTNDYNGAGMSFAIAAAGGKANPEAFLLKIIFTAVTLGCGFKGGKIVPAFFIGATFGAVLGNWIGLDPGFCAALGMISLFSGMDNTPLAGMVMAVELFGLNFGGEGFIYFSMVAAVTYMLTGYFSLYAGREAVTSRLQEEYIQEGMSRHGD